MIDVDSLYASFAGRHDTRHTRGLDYRLVTILIDIVLAKLAGRDPLWGISQWVKHRQQVLAEALQLVKARAPCVNTYRALLGQVSAVEEFEHAVHAFFAKQPGAGHSIVVAIDGKALRGTIPTGQQHGRHLLAAYLPADGRVLCQVEVERNENEITAAPRRLKCLDLRAKVATGDATPALHPQRGASVFAQRELSVHIVDAGGDYIWTVKDNQAALRQDIETLFQPEVTVKGFSPTPQELRTAQTIDKQPGREEQRTLTASSDLKGYLDWPTAEQVFKLERHVKRLG